MWQMLKLGFEGCTVSLIYVIAGGCLYTVIMFTMKAKELKFLSLARVVFEFGRNCSKCYS